MPSIKTEKADDTILNETLNDTIDDKSEIEITPPEKIVEPKSPSSPMENLLSKLTEKYKRKLSFTSGTKSDQVAKRTTPEKGCTSKCSNFGTRERESNE